MEAKKNCLDSPNLSSKHNFSTLTYSDFLLGSEQLIQHENFNPFFYWQWCESKDSLLVNCFFLSLFIKVL